MPAKNYPRIRKGDVMFSRFYIGVLLIAALWIWFGSSFDTGGKIVYTGMLSGGLIPAMWLDTLLKCGPQCLRTVPTMMRIFDILYALPFTIFVIILMVLFGRNIILLFMAIGAVEWLTSNEDT